MNKKYALTAVTSLFTLLLSACGLDVIRGSGHVVTEAREVSGFSRVELLGSGDVVLTQGDQESLKVEAEDNLMGHIRTEVRGHTLYLGLSNDNLPEILQPTRPIKYYVSLKTVEGLAVSGSGNISAEQVAADSLDLGISGSGDIFIGTLTAKTVSSTIHGSGDCEVHSGTASAQEVEISGSGSYTSEKLEGETGSVHITGSGAATIRVSETLDARISGSGDVYYYGTPKVTEHITGSGDLHAKGS